MQILYDAAMTLLWKPYSWNGKNPMGGLDCSGLASILLRTMGMCPPGINDAQMLFDYFIEPANHFSQDPQLGALAFYGTNSKTIDHVGVLLSKRLMIEAGGGSSLIVSVEQAVSKNAYVRITPLRTTRLVMVLMPEYRELQTP